MKQTLTVFFSLLCLLGVLCSSFSLGAAAESAATEQPTQAAPAATHLDPVNPNASPEARSLLSYLQTLNDTNRFVTGTFDIQGTDQVYNTVREQFGKECGLYSSRYKVADQDGNGYRFLDYTNVDEINQKFLAHYRNGNILLIHADSVIESSLASWAIANGISDSADNLILHLDATNPDANPYMRQVWISYLDNLIAALQKLEDLGVKAYMYRPFVEFDSKRFNGIDEEGYAALRRVWQQTSDYLCSSGLTGILMTWAPTAGFRSRYDRYPGNSYVDVLSVTFYSDIASSDPGVGGGLDPNQFQDYAWFVQTGKPIGLSETSCRTGTYAVQAALGRQSWYNTLISMISNWPKISFVNCWGDGSYSLVNETGSSRMEGNDDGYWYVAGAYSITLDELPDYRQAAWHSPGIVQLYTEKNYGSNGGKDNRLLGNWFGLEEQTYSTAQLKALGLDPATIGSFHINTGYGVEFFSGDNATGTCWRYLTGTADTAALPLYGKIRSLRIIRPHNVALEKAEIFASSADEDAWKANDGYSSRWVGAADTDGRGWLVINLDRPCQIQRWVVSHAGSAGEADMYNTADFCLQYSPDGRTWQTVDAVSGNTRSVTDRNLRMPIEGQYFRLLITSPNRAAFAQDRSRITIVEWALYGLETDKDSQNGNLDVLLERTLDIPPSDTEDVAETPSDDPTAPAEWDGEPENDENSNPREDTPKPSKRRRVTKTTVGSYFPWWGWALIAGGSGLLLLFLLWWLLRHRKRTSTEE